MILILLYLRIKDPFSFSRVMSQLTSFKHGKGGGSRRHTHVTTFYWGISFTDFPNVSATQKIVWPPRYHGATETRFSLAITRQNQNHAHPKPSQAKPSNVPFTNKPAECILVPINSDIIQFQLFSFLNFTMNPNSSIFF